jgi:hypothetical protein
MWHPVIMILSHHFLFLRGRFQGMIEIIDLITGGVMEIGGTDMVVIATTDIINLTDNIVVTAEVTETRGAEDHGF